MSVVWEWLNTWGPLIAVLGVLGVLAQIIVSIILSRLERPKREFHHELIEGDDLYQALNLVRGPQRTEYVERDEGTPYLGPLASCPWLLITGPSGCGKTRLAAEIARSIPPYSGDIRYIRVPHQLEVPQQPAPELEPYHLVLIVDDFHDALRRSGKSTTRKPSDEIKLATIEPVSRLTSFIDFCQQNSQRVTVIVTAQSALLAAASQQDYRCQRFLEDLETIAVGVPTEAMRRLHWQKLCEKWEVPIPDEAALEQLLETGDQTLRTPEWFLHDHHEHVKSLGWSEDTFLEFQEFVANQWEDITSHITGLEQELWRAVYALGAIGVPAFHSLAFRFRTEAARQDLPGYTGGRASRRAQSLAWQSLRDLLPVVDGRLVLDDIPHDVDDEMRRGYARCAAKVLARRGWRKHGESARLAFVALIPMLAKLGLTTELHRVCRRFVREFSNDAVAWLYLGASHVQRS